MAEIDKKDFLNAEPKDWEYDFGPSETTGEIASPYINTVMDDISKKAFPEGVEAFQKQRAAELKAKGQK